MSELLNEIIAVWDTIEFDGSPGLKESQIDYLIKRTNEYYKLSDELESLHPAYANANKEIRNLKEQNVKLMNELEINRKSHLNTRNSLKKTDSEVIRLNTENDKLKKSNSKITRNSNELGNLVLKAKNIMRANGLEEWKLLNKANRNARK